MKTKNINIYDIKSIHNHPASVLFRSIELKSLNKVCNDIVFSGPSVDIGCADGKISQLMFDEPFNFGLDNGEVEDYKIAIKNNVFEKVFVESATKTSIKDQSINFAFSNSVLEHIKKIDLVLSETNRILKKDGYFVFTVPSIYFKNYLEIGFLCNTGFCLFDKALNKIGVIERLSKLYSKKLNQKLNHYNLYDHVTWTKMLIKAKFSQVDYAYYINKKTLLVWNFLLILGFLKLNFITRIIFDKLIVKLFENADINKKQGACLVFVCRK